MAVTDDLLEANRSFASGFDKGSLPMPPARAVAVVTCMDARLHPERFLGLELGDAHVIRNAGGRADESALRSLIISQTLLGTREVLVIHHTDCGMLTFSNDDLRGKLQAETGKDVHIDFLPFSDLAESVRDDVNTIRSSPFIAEEIPVRGFIYNVRSGRWRKSRSGPIQAEGAGRVATGGGRRSQRAPRSSRRRATRASGACGRRFPWMEQVVAPRSPSSDQEPASRAPSWRLAPSELKER
jgi:carbonic anhydrase